MPESEPVIIRRVYPANVITPDGAEHRGVLAIVTRERVYVWAGAGGAVQLLFDEAYVQPARPLPHVAQLKSAPLLLAFEGLGTQMLEIRAGSGCGCGSPLKVFRPWAADVSGPTR
jgi:hypothetical protein